MAVILGKWAKRPITISVKPNCLTVSIEGGGGEPAVLSYDYEGRLWTALLDGITYRRGLDGKMVAKWQQADRARDRRWLSPDEARQQIEAPARAQVADLYAAIQSGDAQIGAPLPEQGHHGFRRAIAFDAARSEQDAARYRQVYLPVGILPPDQYFAVVLQAAEGCSFNTCTFCTFYQGRPFRIKPPDDFRAHARAVRDFLGEGLSLRRTIFLGDANALVIPMPRLLPLVEIVHEVYDVERLGGIYAFLDGFSGQKKTADDYAALRALGLKTVYIGMESGSADLLRFLKKPGQPADVVEAVRAIKAGGVAVGVIVLLGAGGHQYAAQHVRDTVAAINAMGLDMDDLIYFSELIVSEGMAYARDAYQAGLQPLTPQERIAQGEAVECGLRFSQAGGMPHISRYDIREFVY
ncbi:MAG: radical SAM protein [Chloroflexi bacterium]|nr:radical SAM protein [Chloroflexota bacterium]